MAQDIDNLSFDRKYRPSSLFRYVGNKKLKDAAMKALSCGKRPQSILLYGDSGCGKTTFARILGKEYSCFDRNDETGACGVCINCQTIDDYVATGDASSLINIKEINISERSGKNDLNDIIEDMMLPSYGDEWKIYIFDECHKATDGQQNMLLKIVEEPPEHVLLIFCTTNPEKLIDTLVNRFDLTLKVQKPTVRELVDLLKYVCDCEQSDYDLKGLTFIANRSDLTIRTSLKNLQRVLNEQDSAKYEDAVKVFEEVSMSLIVDFFTALKTHDIFRYVTLLHEAKSRMELSIFLKELKGFVQRGIYTINGIKQEGISDNELMIYRKLFGDMGVAQVGFLINRLLSLNTNNLEMEMLLLGYTGVDLDVNYSNNEKSIVEELQTLDNETALEKNNATKVLEKKEKENYKRGIENANNIMMNASIESILALGGSLVE